MSTIDEAIGRIEDIIALLRGKPDQIEAYGKALTVLANLNDLAKLLDPAHEGLAHD